MDRIITEDGPIPEAGRWSTGYPASPAQLRSLVNHRFCCPGLDGSPPEKQSAFCPRCAQLALLAELGLRLRVELQWPLPKLPPKPIPNEELKVSNGGEH